jgi:hypothetical protein
MSLTYCRLLRGTDKSSVQAGSVTLHTSAIFSNPTSLRAVSYVVQTRGQHCKRHNNPLRTIPTLPRISITFQNIIVSPDKGVGGGKSRGPERGPYWVACFWLSAGRSNACPPYKLTISDQGPSHSATDSLSFQCSVKKGCRKTFFPRDPNPLSAARRTISRYASIIKFTPVQATKAQKWSTLSLTSALDWVGGQRHVPAALPPRKTWYPNVYETGWAPGPVWTGAEHPPPRDSILGPSSP